MAQFRVGQQPTVGEDRRAHAGPDRQQDYRASLAAAGAESKLGDAGHVGVVADGHGPPEGETDLALGLEADPRRVDVGRRQDGAVSRCAWNAEADGQHGRIGHGNHRLLACGQRLDLPVDERFHDRHDVARLGRLRGWDSDSIAYELAGSTVDHGALDAAAAEVDTDRQVARPHKICHQK